MRVFVVTGGVGGIEREGRGESGDGGSAEIHFERGGQAERFVRDSVMGEANALGEGRPVKIVGGRQELHCAIPESPPTFNFPIALCVMAAGGGASGAGGSGEMGEEFRHELLGFVAVKNTSSSKRGARVAASRLGRAMTDTGLVKLSMIARASVSPVMA